MMRTLAGVAMILSTLVLGQAAEASCAPPEPLSQRIARADVIAFGTVVSEAFSGREYVVRVETVYKGEAHDVIAVRNGPEVPGAEPGRVVTSADYNAPRGTSHTFYLKREIAGFSTDACSGSHPGDLDAEERTALGAGTAPGRALGGPGSATDADRAIAVAVILAALGATFAASRAVLARPA